MSTKLTAARLATSAGVTTIITRASTPSNIFHIVAYVESLKKESAASSPALSRNTSSAALHNLVNPQDPVATSTLYSATQLSAGLPQTSASTTTTGNAASGAAVLPRQHPLHTRFVAKPRALRDRHFWILHGLKPHGTVVIDEGAHRALTRRDKAGLLPVGVLDVQGTFAQQECVRVQVARLNRGAGESGYTVLDAEVGRAVVNYTNLEIARIKGQQSSRIHDLLGYAGIFLSNPCAGQRLTIGKTRSTLPTETTRPSLKKRDEMRICTSSYIRGQLFHSFIPFHSISFHSPMDSYSSPTTPIPSQRLNSQANFTAAFL